MVIYIAIGAVISRKVKNAEDFYVAGRRAPVFLIAGSMIASYTSTGMFMGDAAQCYDGAFAPIIIFAGMQSAGYIIGAIFFGRYLRRSNALTIPEFFGQRFNSNKMRKLAAITAMITMTVYLLSVIQGIGTLMTVVTGLNYNLCITLALIVFAFISIISGSRGVLITDTLMAAVFTFSLIIAALFIANNSGGVWFETLGSLADNSKTQDLISWSGRLGVLYDTGVENIIWGLNYGIVWMSVCMVGPWQSSRYQMARNEHVVVRAAFPAALGVFILEFVSGITAVMVNEINPSLEDSSHVMIWAAMNLMPKLLGVILLTGVLSAGISSATTFLSLIGASFANDIVKAEGQKSINISRISMTVVCMVVLAIAVVNPPSIFWIMFLGGAIVASSWMPVAIASIFSKKLTKTGAFCGMLFGFSGCFILRLYTALAGVTLPVYLDPSVVGMVCNVAAMVVVTKFTKITPEEKIQREKLFIIPDSEKNVQDVKETFKRAKLSVFVGISACAILLVFWILPSNIL